LHALKASLLDTLLDLEVQVKQMHVAGVTGPPNRRNTNLGLVKIGILETSGVKHGLRRTLRLGFGDDMGELVQVLLVT